MKTKFDERIRELRKEKGMTRKALADILGLKQNAIYEWEARGKQTDYETLCKIADYFQVSIDYLLGNDN